MLRKDEYIPREGVGPTPHMNTFWRWGEKKFFFLTKPSGPFTRDFGKSLDHDFDFSANQIAAFGPNADKK